MYLIAGKATWRRRENREIARRETLCAIHHSFSRPFGYLHYRVSSYLGALLAFDTSSDIISYHFLRFRYERGDGDGDV